MKKIICLLSLCLLLAGCNTFGSNYSGMSSSEIENSTFLATCDVPSLYIYPEKSQKDILADMEALGYKFVGESHWYGAADMVTNEDALSKAASLGACVVMWKVEYQFAASTYTRARNYYSGLFFTKIER